MALEVCSCDTKKPFTDCCGPAIAGVKAPATAADLMRSRYTAFVRQEIDYILESVAPERRKEFDRKGIEEWSKKSEWKGLEIVSTEKGGPGDETGKVEFIATFDVEQKEQRHHELATFVKLGGRWYFDDGKENPIKQVRNEGPKLGRNDPCHCGSGKKFKKCHGA